MLRNETRPRTSSAHKCNNVNHVYNVTKEKAFEHAETMIGTSTAQKTAQRQIVHQICTTQIGINVENTQHQDPQHKRNTNLLPL